MAADVSAGCKLSGASRIPDVSKSIRGCEDEDDEEKMETIADRSVATTDREYVRIVM